jgi:hypothetical protein
MNNNIAITAATLHLHTIEVITDFIIVKTTHSYNTHNHCHISIVTIKYIIIAIIWLHSYFHS